MASLALSQPARHPMMMQAVINYLWLAKSAKENQSLKVVVVQLNGANLNGKWF
jgi:hypothetical protein